MPYKLSSPLSINIRRALAAAGALLFALLAAELVFWIKDGMGEARLLRDMELVSGGNAGTGAKSYRSIHEYTFLDDKGCVRMIPGSKGVHPSCDYKDISILVSINSEGIRGPELLPTPEKRILFLGDSIVFAGGVPLERTFVRQLEARLNPGCAARGGYGVEVLNFGASDSGIGQHYARLLHHGLRLKPDYVFLGLYLNDAVPSQGVFGAASMDAVEIFLESPLLSRSSLARHVEKYYRQVKYAGRDDMRRRFRWVERFNARKYLKDREDLIPLVREADLDWGAAWLPESWDKIRFYLEKISVLCRDNGIRLAVFLFPAEPQVRSDVPWEDLDYPQRQMAEIADELGVPFCDLLPGLRLKKEKRIFVDQCHYFTEGNDVVASIIHGFMQENRRAFPGLIEPSP